MTNRKTARPASEAGNGGIADEVLARAEAVIDRLGKEYPLHASRDLASMEQTARMMAGEAEERAPYYGEITRLAHDLSGQGSVFGYPMMTRLAGSLCVALRSLEPQDRAIMSIIDCHIAGMRALLDREVTGSEDRSALTIATGLELLVHTTTAR